MDAAARSVRDDILEHFLAMRSTTGFALTLPWIKTYIGKLGDTGQAIFDSACQALTDEGLVKVRSGGPRGNTVVITRKGIETIYPDPDPETLRLAVLTKFREIGAKEGYILPDMWLQHDYERSLNELELEILQETLRDMASEGLVEYVARPSPNLKVTAFGLMRIEELGL